MAGAYTFTEAEVKALTNPDVLERIRNFKSAKVTVIQRVTTATEQKASRITGRKYYRHENDSVTARFGKKLPVDTYETVVAAIKLAPTFAALFTGGQNVLNKYRFVPEGE